MINETITKTKPDSGRARGYISFAPDGCLFIIGSAIVARKKVFA